MQPDEFAGMFKPSAPEAFQQAGNALRRWFAKCCLVQLKLIEQHSLVVPFFVFLLCTAFLVLPAVVTRGLISSPRFGLSRGLGRGLRRRLPGGGLGSRGRLLLRLRLLWRGITAELRLLLRRRLPVGGLRSRRRLRLRLRLLRRGITPELRLLLRRRLRSLSRGRFS